MNLQQNRIDVSGARPVPGGQPAPGRCPGGRRVSKPILIETTSQSFFHSQIVLSIKSSHTEDCGYMQSTYRPEAENLFS